MKIRRVISLVIRLLCLTFVGTSILIGVFKNNIISVQVVIGLIFFIAIISDFVGSKNITASTKKLNEYIDNTWKEEIWYKDKDKEAETMAENYLFNLSVFPVVFNCLIYGLLLAGEIYSGRQFGVFNISTNTLRYDIFINIFLLFMAITLLQGSLWYIKFNKLLYNRCDPYLYILTINRILNFPKARYTKLNYNYRFLIALSLGLTGDYYFAREYIEAVDGEYGKKLGKKDLALSYCLKFDVLMYYKYYSEARELKTALENKKKKNIYEKQILANIEKDLWVIDGNYEEALEFNESQLKIKKQKLLQVAYHFRLIEIYMKLGNMSEANQCIAYVLSHGNNTYYAKECNVLEN